MKHHAVIFAPEAKADLLALYTRIADAGGEERAFDYIQRIMAFCDAFDVFPERGTRRDDIRPGLRTVGFERRITIAFTVEQERVEFLRFFYGGRDWERLIAGNAG